MLVTIDGPCATGKTTQTSKLVNKHNFEFSHFGRLREATVRIYNQISATNNNHFTPFLAWAVSFHLATPINDRDVVIGEYWTVLLQCLINDTDSFERNINFFRTAMTLNNQKEPDLSVILAVPHDVKIERLIHRYARGKCEVESFNVVPESKDNIEFYDSAHRLAEMVPYVEFVDGTQPIDQVTESILQLIDSKRQTSPATASSL